MSTDISSEATLFKCCIAFFDMHDAKSVSLDRLGDLRDLGVESIALTLDKTPSL
jgi:hypothetical protein